MPSPLGWESHKLKEKTMPVKPCKDACTDALQPNNINAYLPNTDYFTCAFRDDVNTRRCHDRGTLDDSYVYSPTVAAKPDIFDSRNYYNNASILQNYGMHLNLENERRKDSDRLIEMRSMHAMPEEIQEAVSEEAAAEAAPIVAAPPMPMPPVALPPSLPTQNGGGLNRMDLFFVFFLIAVIAFLYKDEIMVYVNQLNVGRPLRGGYPIRRYY